MGFKSTVNKVGGFLKDTWNNLTGKTANDIASQGVGVSRLGIEATERANKANIESQERINAENVALQERLNQANIDWARELNNIEMARADSAHQREVADMRKAGLSPFASMNGADVGSLSAPTLSAPVLNAPLNDVGSIGSSFNNMASALGNQAQVINTNRANTLNYALGMLNFVKGEQSLKHQKDYDNETIELARSEFDLSSKRDSINNAYTQVLSDRTKVETDISLSDEQRKSELHVYDVKQKALEVCNQSLTNQNMTIANNRSQLAYQSEQKDFAYKDRMLEVQFNRECEELAYTIAQKRNTILERVIMENKDLRDEHLTDAQIKKIAQDLELDVKKYRMEVWKNVIQSIFTETKKVTPLAKKLIK